MSCVYGSMNWDKYKPRGRTWLLVQVNNQKQGPGVVIAGHLI